MMQRIVLCTSSSGIDYLDKPDNLRVLRHYIDINGKKHRDGESMNYQDIADKMMADKQFLPVSSPQSEEELLQVFEDLYAEGFQEVFIVALSSQVSDTYNHLINAKEKFRKQMFIHIYDSRTIAYSEAVLAMTAARMMNAGKSTIDVYRHLNELREGSKFWIAMDDLSYFVKSKRLATSTGLFAKVFNIKPVLMVDSDGLIVPIERVRKIDRALDLLCEHALREFSEREGKLYLVDFGNKTLLQKAQRLLEEQGFNNVKSHPAAPSTIANHGPHGVGIGISYDDLEF